MTWVLNRKAQTLMVSETRLKGLQRTAQIRRRQTESTADKSSAITHGWLPDSCLTAVQS